MPSIEVIEQFKQQVQSLAKENEIREAQGLSPEEITPPESQLSDDLADLLGGMPGEPPTDTGDGDEINSLLAEKFADPMDSSDLAETPAEDEDPLAGLFDSPEVAPASADGLSDLDALLGLGEGSESSVPGPSEFESVPEPGVGESDNWDETFSGEPISDPAPQEESFDDTLTSDLPEELTDLDTLTAGEEEFSPYQEEGAPPFEPEEAEDAEALQNLDDLLSDDKPVKAYAARDGVSAEDLNDDFFSTPGEELFQVKGAAPAASGDEDEFVFDDGSSDSDFPELAGFASTKEEDVEAFDAMGEADEFQLGDFESQFGITADDHHDSDLLNPAQAIDQEIADAQKTLSLGEDEFAAIQKTLSLQPLNLKLAIEELIGEKEVVFDDLNKIVRMLVSGASSKSLAVATGKILGKKIVIPAGYEKGSGEALEQQKSSLWFNIKTVMLPILRVSAFVSAVAAILVILAWNFLLKPFKAQDLYNKGLEQVRLNNGDLADDLFAQAYYYWPARDRFFQYAEAYMDSGDYDRARRKYLEILKPSIRPFTDADKKVLGDKLGIVTAPMPPSLDEAHLKELIHQRKMASDVFYQTVIELLSKAPDGTGGDITAPLAGQVIFNNYDYQALMDLSSFETYYGADSRSVQAHFLRADAVLAPIFAQDKTQKEALLRKGDNFLEWASAISSRDRFEDANTAFSAYMQKYGNDAPITWRFVKLFLLVDDEKEILNLRHRIMVDKKMTMDGEVMARLAGWLLDRDESRDLKEKQPVVVPKTLEEEYGIKAAVSGKPGFTSEKNSTSRSIEKNSVNLFRSEGGGEGGGESKDKKIEITPPYKYPYSSQLFRPDYLEDLDKLLIRCLDNSKELPEIHYQLSRYYRRFKNSEDEKKALAAADVYFQRMEPRKIHLNDRTGTRIATLNRIGEIFKQQKQAIQAEKYFLDAQRYFETAYVQGVVKSDEKFSRIYVNLGDLYYEQTPGASQQGVASLGSWDQALKLYEKAEAAKFTSPDVTYHKAVIYYEKQDFSRAVKELFKLEQSPRYQNNLNVLYAMANALFRNGNVFAAQGYYLSLYEILQEKRNAIKEFDVVKRHSHLDLAKYIFVINNNLGAALYRGSTAIRSGSREYKEALNYLTIAQAMAVTLGQQLLESKEEFDITTVDELKLQQIREETQNIVAKTRRERGLVEANLKVLSLAENASPAKRAELVRELEIFSRIPLELEIMDSP